MKFERPRMKFGKTAPRSRSRSSPWGAALVAVLFLITSGLAYQALTRPQVEPRCTQSNELITIIGDSYVAGTDMDSGEKSRFPALLHSAIQTRQQVFGLSGSGYVTTGPGKRNMTFPEAGKQVTVDSQLVIVYGSRNDSPYDSVPSGDITSAVTTLADNVRMAAPRARLIIVGPSWVNDEVPDRMIENRDAIKRGAERAHVEFVDPIEDGWFAKRSEITDGRNKMIGTDHIHPNDRGHAYLAKKFEKIVASNLPCQKV